MFNKKGDLKWEKKNMLIGPQLSKNEKYFLIFPNRSYEADLPDVSLPIELYDIDGTLKWRIKAPNASTNAKILDDGKVALSVGDTISLIDVDGTALWTYRFPTGNFRKWKSIYAGKSKIAVVLKHSRVHDSELYFFDEEGGFLWKRKFEMKNFVDLKITKNNIIALHVLGGQHAGTSILSLNMKNGNILWEKDFLDKQWFESIFPNKIEIYKGKYIIFEAVKKIRVIENKIKGSRYTNIFVFILDIKTGDLISRNTIGMKNERRANMEFKNGIFSIKTSPGNRYSYWKLME